MQTGTEAHPIFKSMGNEGCSAGLKLKAHIHTAPRLRICGAYIQSPVCPHGMAQGTFYFLPLNRLLFHFTGIFLRSGMAGYNELLHFIIRSPSSRP
jgi:hypothetical protein